jgi:hypothetical protein
VSAHNDYLERPTTIKAPICHGDPLIRSNDNRCDEGNP